MTLRKTKWAIDDLSQAMVRAITQGANERYLRQDGNILKFNGFWRDGDKQNVCAWLDKATWHDAKTGEGGGCKEFAKIAFNQTLPEFMDRFGSSFSLPARAVTINAITNNQVSLSLDEIWSKLSERSKHSANPAKTWLEKIRGFNEPEINIGSGFASLFPEDVAIFRPEHQGFIRQRLLIGAHIIVPIRDTYSNRVQNLFFRAISEIHKSHKSRLLPDAGGWNNQGRGPRAFGFPHLLNDFPKLILCEGMADYFAVECLLGCGNNFLAVGAANASALKNWATWLCESNYKGTVTILYQLDKDKTGKVSFNAVGQLKACEALKILLQAKISATLFNWAAFLRRIQTHEHRPNDIADVCAIFGSHTINEAFVKTLNEVD